MVAHANAKTGTDPVKENGHGTRAPTEHEQRRESSAVEKRKGNTVGPIYLRCFSSADAIAAHETVPTAASLIGFDVYARVQAYNELAWSMRSRWTPAAK